MIIVKPSRVHLERGVERLLRNVDLAEPMHALLHWTVAYQAARFDAFQKIVDRRQPCGELFKQSTPRPHPLRLASIGPRIC
jgi:hypothetical protein